MSLSGATRLNRRKLMAGAAVLAGVCKMSQGTAWRSDGDSLRGITGRLHGLCAYGSDAK